MIIGLALEDARFQWKRRENNTPVASAETQAREKYSVGGKRGKLCVKPSVVKTMLKTL